MTTTKVFDEWFAQLTTDAQAEAIAKVNLLKLFGPQLKRPHADTLKGSKHANMKELRADTRDKRLRIAFAFDQKRAAVLLIGGNKLGVSQHRFYKQLIARADALYDEYLTAIRKRPSEGN